MTKLIAKSSSNALHGKEFFGATKGSHRGSNRMSCSGFFNFFGIIARSSSFPSSRRTRALFLYAPTKLEILLRGAPYCLHGDNMMLPVNSGFSILSWICDAHHPKALTLPLPLLSTMKRCRLKTEAPAKSDLHF